MRDSGDTIGFGASHCDGEIRGLCGRFLRLLLEVLHHPVLLLGRVAAAQVIALLVIAAPFRAGRIGCRSAAGNGENRQEDKEDLFHRVGELVAGGAATWRSLP